MHIHKLSSYSGKECVNHVTWLYIGIEHSLWYICSYHLNMLRITGTRTFSNIEMELAVGQ